MASAQERTPRSPSFSRRLAEGLYAYRLPALAVGLLLAVLAAGPLGEIEVGNTLRQYVVEDDPALERYQQFQDTYGNDETVVVGLRRPAGFFTPEGLSLLRTATDRIRQVVAVVDVRSLTTQMHVQPALTGPRLRPLVPPGSLTNAQASALHAYVQADSALGRFVSDDGTMAAVLARMPQPPVFRAGAAPSSTRFATASAPSTSPFTSRGSA